MFNRANDESIIDDGFDERQNVVYFVFNYGCKCIERMNKVEIVV